MPPANEQPWRNQKLMHVVFGISSILMLLSTIWMFAADHAREWKTHQRKFREMAASRLSYQEIQQDTDSYRRKLQALDAELAAIRHAFPPHRLVEAFRDEVAVQSLFDLLDADHNGKLTRDDFGNQDLVFSQFHRDGTDDNGDAVVQREDLLGAESPDALDRNLNQAALDSLLEWKTAKSKISALQALIKEGEKRSPGWSNNVEPDPSDGDSDESSTEADATAADDKKDDAKHEDSEHGPEKSPSEETVHAAEDHATATAAHDPTDKTFRVKLLDALEAIKDLTVNREKIQADETKGTR
ncbi:MAG: hypothetical protein N2C14_11355, partial [Planctomycetales bacterium]